MKRRSILILIAALSCSALDLPSGAQAQDNTPIDETDRSLRQKFLAPETADLKLTAKERRRLETLAVGLHKDQLSKEVLAAYLNYEPEAVAAKPNVILCSVPAGKDMIEMESKNAYPRAEKPASLVREGNRIKTGEKKAWDDSDATELRGKIRLSIQPLPNSKLALMNTISSTYTRARTSQRPSSWTGGKAIETPFDFTFNYLPGRAFRLIASYFNARISIDVEDGSLAKPLPMAEMAPAFVFATGLFSDYKTAKDVRKVDYLDLKPEIEKNDGDKTGIKFRMDCAFREQHKDMKDKFWLLAVSDKGELSLDKAIYHFKKRQDLATGNIYYISDGDEEKQHDSPDTVFLTLPEGEKTAVLTFYFISGDGTQYSAQSITLSAAAE